MMLLKERLAKLDTSVVSDVLDESGLLNQTLCTSFRPLDARLKLCGVALCARGREVVRLRQPAPASVSAYEIEREMSAGQVLVLDAGSEKVGAPVGGFVAATLKAKGCAGLLINGAIRDALEINEFELPTFFRFHTPVNASRRWELIDLDVPVFLPGISDVPVTIQPGDLILGDADGIVVVPLRFAEDVIEASERLQEIERAIREEIKAGATREEAFSRNPRFNHIKRLLPSGG